MAIRPTKFQFAIDRGGTFTDVFARCPGGKIRVLKLLSEDPQHYQDAPTEGIRRILHDVWKVCYKPNEEFKKNHYDEKQAEVLKLIESHINHRNLLHAKRTFDSNLTDSKITERFIRSLRPRTEMKLAPRHWIVDDLRPFIIKNVLNQVDESQPVEYLTEMREVTIQFINIIPVSYYDPVLVRMVNNAYQIICRIVGEVLGVVNKVSLFDKDCMILVLFGLRGVKHEMESQNALRSAFKIRNAIAQLENVKCISVGVTNGLVYCGVVGHPMRREYTVIGGAVNKAARIMCVYEEKVTCDHKTFKRSQLSSFYFQLQKTVKLKGIEDAGNIFEYNEHFDKVSSEQKASPPLIGRNPEYNYICRVICDSKAETKYFGVCLHGANKIGKTAILRSVLEAYTNVVPRCRNIASVELEGCAKIPYSCVSKIYKQLYDQKFRIDDRHGFPSKNLPRDLNEFMAETFDGSDDFALQKYTVLNCFRDMICFKNSTETVVFIDNVENMDLQSWEIVEIVINEGEMRLVMAGLFADHAGWDLQFKISLNDHIRMIELQQIHDMYVPAIACQFLEATGIPSNLAAVLVKSCSGRPGYIQSCILRLVNNANIEMKLINKSEKDYQNFIYPPVELMGIEAHPEIIPIIEYSQKHKVKTDELTLAAISLDLFDSFTAYQQLVIKTGAVLGELFTRTVLIVALKYPAEITLAKVIAQLFEEEVFDCGSRYVYPNEIDTNKYCCKCYFEDNYFNFKDNRETLPKYAYCKIIHFKNKSIRDVAYDLLPGNQRKELHLLCTDVLENMSHRCPTCLREPTTSFLNFYKFKDIMEYCNDPNQQYKFNAIKQVSNDVSRDNIKETIRNNITKSLQKGSIINFRRKPMERPAFDESKCKCVEISARIYQDLIYHSEMAGHLGKRIFFSMQHGFLLIGMHDYSNAIAILTEARELCMMDARLPNSQITNCFRKLHVGKIQMGLGKAHLMLRQLKAARNHLAIALRQYNIPAIAMYYKMYSGFISRSFLINARYMKPFLYKNTIARSDMGMCLAYCAKLFNLEGNMGLAKLACSYSIYLLRTVNMNTPILFQEYCSVIEIYRYCSDAHTCEKFQRYALRDMQLQYAQGVTQNLYSLMELLKTALEIQSSEGDLIKAIRLGFRIIDINLKIGTDTLNLNLLMWVSIMLMYNFRLKDSVDVIRLMFKTPSYLNKKFEYYLTCLVYHLRTAFSIEPISTIILYAENYFARKTSTVTFDEQMFILALQLYYLRNGKYQQAEDWRHQCSFNSRNVRRAVVLRTLIYNVESRIYMYLRSRRQKNPYLDVEEKMIWSHLKLIEVEVRTRQRIFLPQYLCLLSWYHMIKAKPKKANRCMEEAVKVCNIQRNIMVKCYILQLKSYWASGAIVAQTSHTSICYESAYNYTPREWARIMHPCPLE